jgi:hypothetical protein
MFNLKRKIQNYLKIFLPILFILINTRCDNMEFINPKPIDQLVVHCVLLPSNVRQKVLVTKVVGNDENALKCINDVTVTVNDIILNQNGAFDWFDPYNFYSDTLEILPGKKYSLLMESLEYPEVKGETIVPGDFSILEPDTYTIRWTKSKNAHGYLVKLVKVNNQRIYRETVLDTFYQLPANSEGWYKAEIQAFDSHYYNYFVLKEQQAGIVGALGLFGTLIKRERKIFFD